MKIKKEKVKINVYGLRQNFRFSFILKYHTDNDFEQDIKRMIIEGRREAKRIFRESNGRMNAEYDSYLEKIVWLKYSNGLGIGVRG